MSFFSDERTNELRELFFESAQELLQALNEEGLELEKRPGDAEVIRSIRRTVHTLKGDSAACGYKELSELAHELEDVLTPDLARRDAAEVVQVVLAAADMFDSMLQAYRGQIQPPVGDPLRELINTLKEKPAGQEAQTFAPAFSWSEYERLIARQNTNGSTAFCVGVQIDPQCLMKSAALQMIYTVLKEAGTVLVGHPEQGVPADGVTAIEAIVASNQSAEWIARKCRIPSISLNVVVQPFATAEPEVAAGTHVPEAIGPIPEINLESILDSACPAPGTSIIEVQAAAQEPSHTQVVAAAPAAVAAPAASAAPVPPAPAENILRVDADRIDVVLNLVGELIIGKSMLQQAISEFGKRFPKDPLRNKFGDMMALQSQALNELQRSVMKIRMVPVEQLFRRYPRVVRDVAKSRSKDVVLDTSGTETDLDKSVLDALAEPMTHLVRNAVDHGIESPEERLAAGKPAQGTVRLDAYHHGNQVVIEIADDGRGIDPQKVIAKAISSGIVTPENASRMTDGEILELVFEPGFSTASEVTAISGRGVGLDIVKTVLQRMKGSVSVESELGRGTTFKLRVPLTLAIIRALLFRTADRLYAVPISSVLEITRAWEKEIHRVDGHEVLKLRDDIVTLIRPKRLAKARSAPARETAGKMFIIVVSLVDRKFGLIVDKVVGEAELVIKALDDHVIATDLVSGASILGDGTVVLILNVSALVERLGRVKDASQSFTEVSNPDSMRAQA
jgi:two-component system, chemotaxis family, sensor kinase CheA